MERHVRFGAELTFDRVRSSQQADEAGAGTRMPSVPSDIRAAPELTVLITEVHERTADDVIAFLDRIIEDRDDRFDGVHIDLNHAESSDEIEAALSS